MTYPPEGNRPYQPYVQPQQQWQSQPPSYGRPSYPQGPARGGHIPAADLPLAPIHRRAGARLLDAVMVWAFGFAVVFPITVGAIGVSGGAKNNDGPAWSTSILVTTFIVTCVLPFLYEAVLLTMWGQTFGKRFLGLSVVDTDPAGEPIGLPKAAWRAAINNVGYPFGIFVFLLLGVTVWEYFLVGMFFAAVGVLLSYLWAIWDRPLHQAVHDRYAGTVVVDDREYEEE